MEITGILSTFDFNHSASKLLLQVHTGTGKCRPQPAYRWEHLHLLNKLKLPLFPNPNKIQFPRGVFYNDQFPLSASYSGARV